MRRAQHRAICDRSREQISLGLDGQLSQLELVMLEGHLEHCSACRAYAAEARALVSLLREAPLERPTAVTVGYPLRSAMARRLQGGVAAVLALAVVGIGSQVAGHPLRATGDSVGARSAQILRFPTREDDLREQQLVESAVAGVDLGKSGPESVR